MGSGGTLKRLPAFKRSEALEYSKKFTGTREQLISNNLQLIVESISDQFVPTSEIEVLETNIDNLNPDFLTYLEEKLLAIPCLTTNLRWWS